MDAGAWRWSEDDPRYIFVMGAKWWQLHTNGATAFAAEVDEMEREAQRRFPDGRVPGFGRSPAPKDN